MLLFTFVIFLFFCRINFCEEKGNHRLSDHHTKRNTAHNSHNSHTYHSTLPLLPLLSNKIITGSNIEIDNINNLLFQTSNNDNQNNNNNNQSNQNNNQNNSQHITLNVPEINLQNIPQHSLQNIPHHSPQNIPHTFSTANSVSGVSTNDNSESGFLSMFSNGNVVELSNNLKHRYNHGTVIFRYSK